MQREHPDLAYYKTIHPAAGFVFGVALQARPRLGLDLRYQVDYTPTLRYTNFNREGLPDAVIRRNNSGLHLHITYRLFSATLLQSTKKEGMKK